MGFSRFQFPGIFAFSSEYSQKIWWLFAGHFSLVQTFQIRLKKNELLLKDWPRELSTLYKMYRTTNMYSSLGSIPEGKKKYDKLSK